MTRRGNRDAPAVIILVGVIGLANVAPRQRFAAYHTVDVIQLLASGRCIGVALMAPITLFRQSRD